MSVRKSLAWSYGAQGLIFIVTFGSSVVVARILGPYEMGIFAVGAATAGALSILSAFGVGPYLVRHEAPDGPTKAAVFTVNAVLNVVVSLVVAAVALAGPLFDLNTSVQHVLALFAIVPLISIFEFLPATLLQRDSDFRMIALITIGRSFVNSLALIALAMAGLGSLSPAIAMVMSALCSTIAFNVIGFRHASVRIGLEDWRSITRFGLQMMSIGGVAGLSQRLSELALGRLLGFAALGVYTRAASLSNQIWDNVYGLATRVIFSQMADEMRTTRSVSKTFLSGIGIITAVIWPLLAGVAVLSGPLIHALYGDQWHGAAIPLAIIMCAQIIALGFGMNWELCVLRERTGWQARIEATRAVAGLATFTAGSFVSLPAAAAGRIVEALVGLLHYGPKMREMAGTDPGQISRVYLQSSALMTVAAAPALVLMIVFDWSPHTPWSLVAVSVVIGVALWLLLLRWFEHRVLAEMIRLLIRITGRFQRQVE